MEHIAATVRGFYQNDPAAVYENGVYLSCADGAVQCECLRDVMEVREARDIFAERLDRISDRLAFVQAEYRDGPDYRTEAIGLIRCGETWQVICVLSSHPQHRFEVLYERAACKQLNNLHNIEEILLRYCEDVYQMDAEDCLQLFWPQTRMYHPNEDQTFSDVPIQVLHSRWDNMPDPGSFGAENFSRIYHVELLDDTTALAKIGCAKLDNFFKDYLFLMRIQNRWMIVNKMTHVLHTGRRV